MILRHLQKQEVKKTEDRNPKQAGMSEIQMTQTGSHTTRGNSEQYPNGCVEHSDTRFLTLFRISGFVVRICGPRIPKSRSVI